MSSMECLILAVSDLQSARFLQVGVTYRVSEALPMLVIELPQSKAKHGKYQFGEEDLQTGAI